MTITVSGSTLTFSDSTTQTTAATPLSTITYANRGTLRSTTPSSNLTNIVIESLGVFTYYATNVVEPDDDETAFLVSGGPAIWLLTAPSNDIINAYDLPDLEYITAKVG